MTVFLKRHKLLIIAFAAIALAVSSGFLWYRNRYPYGSSHCCIKVLMFALEQYADDHNGRYPAGQPTPEACLGLLHNAPYDLTAETLRGKSVPIEVVQRVFDQGGRLRPDTCGWHYIARLTQNDDRRLAILWDKVGLGHFGERWGNGSREVLFVVGEMRMIPKSEWSRFLEEQKDLLGKRDELAINGGFVLTATVKMPRGEIVNQMPTPFRIDEESVSEAFSSKGVARSGSALGPADLRWKGIELLPTVPVTKTFILSFPEKQMRSKPVKVKVENGRAIPNAIVFETEVTEQR